MINEMSQIELMQEKKNHTQQKYNSLQRKAKYYKIITFDKMDDDQTSFTKTKLLEEIHEI